MLENKDIIALAKVAAKADKSAPVAYSFGEKKYSFDQVNETLAQELSELYATDTERCFSVIKFLINSTQINAEGPSFI